MESTTATQPLESTQWFNEHFKIGLKQTLKFSLGNPRMALFMAGKLAQYNAANRRRQYWREQGVQVPPMLIYSITHQCNLNCAGCYAKVLHASGKTEFNAHKFADVVRQANEIGVSYILLAGGEPFTRPELLDVISKYPNIIFTPFTNGMLINDDHIQKLKKNPHVIPVVSLEGYAEETDTRRGVGVYENGLSLLERLHKEGVYYGVSITTTRDNFDTISRREYVEKLIALGCKVFFFINYLPVEKGTEALEMSQAQVEQLNQILGGYRDEYPALFLAFPGSEVEMVGCLAAGKGFVHINASGDVEPCPFSPYTDASLRDMPLIEALRSPLLRKIRENDFQLEESNGACALWHNREWVEELVATDKNA